MVAWFLFLPLRAGLFSGFSCRTAMNLDLFQNLYVVMITLCVMFVNVFVSSVLAAFPFLLHQSAIWKIAVFFMITTKHLQGNRFLPINICELKKPAASSAAGFLSGFIFTYLFSQSIPRVYTWRIPRSGTVQWAPTWKPVMCSRIHLHILQTEEYPHNNMPLPQSPGCRSVPDHLPWYKRLQWPSAPEQIYCRKSQNNDKQLSNHIKCQWFSALELFFDLTKICFQSDTCKCQNKCPVFILIQYAVDGWNALFSECRNCYKRCD